MVRRTAAVMAMVGFALGCLLGALTGSGLEGALLQSLAAMGGFFLVGLGVGRAAELLMREHFEALARSGEHQDAHRPTKRPVEPGTGA